MLHRQLMVRAFIFALMVIAAPAAGYQETIWKYGNGRCQPAFIFLLPKLDPAIDYNGDGVTDWHSLTLYATSNANPTNKMSMYVRCLDAVGGLAQYAGEILRSSNNADLKGKSPLQVL